MYQHSKMLHIFCYKAFIGDRDSSSYLVIDRTRLYNPMTMIEKLKCTNLVQRQFGQAKKSCFRIRSVIFYYKYGTTKFYLQLSIFENLHIFVHVFNFQCWTWGYIYIFKNTGLYIVRGIPELNHVN